MTNEMLDKIRELAEENWNLDNDDPKRIWGEHEEFTVTNPWMDCSGRFPLKDDVAAVKEWGLATVMDFCEKAQEIIERREQHV